MVDYRKFLGTQATTVAPFLGAARISLGDRSVLLDEPPTVEGWYSVRVSGRTATIVGPAEPPSLDALPAVRGWFFDGRLFLEGARSEPLWLLGAEEPAAFGAVRARRWPSGELLFDGLEFESEAEGAVRAAVGGGEALAAIKGVPAGLRAAAGFALVQRRGRELNVPFAFAEVRAALGTIAQGGAEAASTALRALEAERIQARREEAEQRARLAQAQLAQELEASRQEQIRAAQAVGDDMRRAAQRAAGNPRYRAELALFNAGAQLETLRRLGREQLELVFRFRGERFICLVHEYTLRVLDAGVCLGHPPPDEQLTLESLPGVINQAMEEDRLVILRFP